MPKLIRKLTPKQTIKRAEPKALLDYSEVLRAAGKPCWFIRHGWQGGYYTGLCASPRAAWKAAYDSFMYFVRTGKQAA